MYKALAASIIVGVGAYGLLTQLSSILHSLGYLIKTLLIISDRLFSPQIIGLIILSSYADILISVVLDL